MRDRAAAPRQARRRDGVGGGRREAGRTGHAFTALLLLLPPWKLGRRCYDRFDHFCNYTGTPVTRTNHLTFITFVLLQVRGGERGGEEEVRGGGLSLSPHASLQFLANLLFLADLWAHVGAAALADAASAPLLPPAHAAADGAAAPATTQWGVFWGSPWLLCFAVANCFGLLFAAVILVFHVRLAAVNVTTNEVREGQLLLLLLLPPALAVSSLL